MIMGRTIINTMIEENLVQGNIETQKPFEHTKIPVCYGLSELENFISQYPDFSFCPYVADKDAEGWEKSTSRQYMNQILSNFLYVPVNISKGDTEQLGQLIERMDRDERVAAINITQPHKSSPALRKIFFGNEDAYDNVDTLIKNSSGKLVPYDLNAPAFVAWFNDEIGSFEDKAVVLIGVGGVGEPVAKRIASQLPRSLMLIEPNDKSELVAKLSSQTAMKYAPSLKELSTDGLAKDVIVINASGKDGASTDMGIEDLLRDAEGQGKVFVDLRPQLELPVVEAARAQGWRAFTGNGMNARNDYELLSGITDYLAVAMPTFDEFKSLVQLHHSSKKVNGFELCNFLE